jgi:hypothetical protein
MTPVGSQFCKVMRARVTLESADASLTIASTCCDVTLFIKGSKFITFTGHALHILTLFTTWCDVVMHFAAALSCERVTGFIETVGCVTIAGSTNWGAPPMAGADLFFNGVAVPAHLAEVILALTSVSSGIRERTNTFSGAEKIQPVLDLQPFCNRPNCNTLNK